MAGWEGDWSSAGALRGRNARACLNQLIGAYNERKAIAGTAYPALGELPADAAANANPATTAALARIQHYIRSVAERFVAPATTPIAVEDYFDGSSVKNRYTTANIEGALDEELIDVAAGGLLRPWIYQQYRILNLLRVHYVRRTSEPRRTYDSFSWLTDDLPWGYFDGEHRIWSSSTGVGWTGWRDIYSWEFDGDDSYDTDTAFLGAYNFVGDDHGGPYGDAKRIARETRADIYWRPLGRVPNGMKYDMELLVEHYDHFHYPFISPSHPDTKEKVYGNAPDPAGRTGFGYMDTMYSLSAVEGGDTTPVMLGEYESGEPTDSEWDKYVGYTIRGSALHYDFAVEGGFEYGDWIEE